MHLLGLRTLLALGNLEFDARPVVERLVAVHLDRGEVDEDVLPTVNRDESVPLLAVEPLDGALCHCALPHSAVPRVAVADPGGRRLDARQKRWRTDEREGRPISHATRVTGAPHQAKSDSGRTQSLDLVTRRQCN